MVGERGRTGLQTTNRGLDRGVADVLVDVEVEGVAYLVVVLVYVQEVGFEVEKVDSMVQLCLVLVSQPTTPNGRVQADEWPPA